MRNLLRYIIAGVVAVSAFAAVADKLIILHTNDTHSNIDSAEDGTGGILPRKAIIDSVRKAEKNVILVDAGDMVQGTLYFNNFRGDVEYPLFNMMDYDIRILGNHEFDNGLEELAAHWKNVKGARLSANYDFSETPAKGIFEPYVIKKVAGKKVGFIGINVDPESLIVAENYAGMKYEDAVKTANKYAAFLKQDKKCDLVVAVTHIGYTTDVDKETDVDLAKSSRDIDIIIGGHSHTFVDPSHPEKNPHRILNADGREVIVAQTGKYGKNVGYISVDLDQLTPENMEYRYIPVTDRFPDTVYDKKMKEFLAPYKHKVDSVNNNIIAFSLMDMNNNDRNGAYANWAADFIKTYTSEVADSLRSSGRDIPTIDFAITNCGGIRQPLNKGEVTEGKMLATFPFANYAQIIRIKGADVIEALQAAANKGGEAISSELRVVAGQDGKIQKVVFNGRELDPEKCYTVGTIDYVANGNDGLVTMANNETLWLDSQQLNVRILDYLRRLTSLGVPISSDPNGRFIFSENNK